MKTCARGSKNGNGADADRVAAHALADLRAISEYIEQDRNVETANRVTRAIYDAIQSLRRLPYRGRYGRVENTREMVVPGLPYLELQPGLPFTKFCRSV
jgi:hypothetical protein